MHALMWYGRVRRMSKEIRVYQSNVRGNMEVVIPACRRRIEQNIISGKEEKEEGFWRRQRKRLATWRDRGLSGKATH